MRTACILRKSWSQLHTASRRIVGSSYVPQHCPNPQISAINLGERFLSSFPVIPVGVPLPFNGARFRVAAFASPTSNGNGRNRQDYYQDGSFVSFSLGPSVGPGFFHFARSATKINYKVKYQDGTFANHEDENSAHGRAPDEEDNGNVRLPAGGVLGDVNNFRILQCLGKEEMGPKRKEEGGGALRNVAFTEGVGVISPRIARRGLRKERLGNATFAQFQSRAYASEVTYPPKPAVSGVAGKKQTVADYSQRAVVTALWCNFLVFSLKLGVWFMTSSHVMLAETIHSLADLANQALIAYGLASSRREPDALHPYGYSKERFVWSLISAVGIFCLGSGATIVHGVQNLWHAEPVENTYLAALVIGGSMIMEGASLLVAISCVRNGAREEGMSVRDYLWRGHDPTTVAVMMEDGAAVTGLAVAGLALLAVRYTGNPVWDPIGSIVVGNLLGAVAIFLIQRNRHALLGRSMDEKDMMRVLNVLSKDPVVDAIYDCKSEMIGPGAYRFKAEIDFNGVTIVQNYIRRAGRGNWLKEFQDAVSSPELGQLDRVMAAYGEEVVSALGSEVDRLEREIQKAVPGVRHVDIETHNPYGPTPREKFYLKMTAESSRITA